MNRWTYRRSRLSRAGLARTVFAGTCLAIGLAPPAGATNAAERAGDRRVIGVVGTASLSEADIVAGNQADFERLESDLALQRRQLEYKQAKMRHDLLQQRLDQRLDLEALEMEAKSRGVAPDAVLAGITAATPSDDDARMFYAANRDRIKQPYEAVAPQILQYLQNQRQEAAKRSFYDELRARHGISSRLDAYRIFVAATGPVRGPATAPVTIVEFADFQCPYCKEAESSLRAILGRHPQDVRLVFRHLPLTQIHPNARIAAQASVCADQQGKFWELHDAMYSDQGALNREALTNTATLLGMQPGPFSTCMDDAATNKAIDADAAAARDLGLDGTPYFFVNGRPIDGSVPQETFEKVIADELRRHSPRGAVH